MEVPLKARVSVGRAVGAAGVRLHEKTTLQARSIGVSFARLCLGHLYRCILPKKE